MQLIEVNNTNGIIAIQNTTYPSKVHCDDMSNIPDIGVGYTYLQWSDAPWYECFYVDMTNHIQPLTDEMITIIEEICTNWTQPLGQEGNPTLEQARQQKQADLTNKFNMDVDVLTSSTAMSEIISWTKQESEARAWLYNTTVYTPFIDGLLASRNSGKTEGLETKQELVSKIISKADAYNTAYATLLGEYQNKLSAVAKATTVDEVNSIE